MICNVTIVGFTILDVVAKINLFSLFCTALFTSHVSQLTPLPLGPWHLISIQCNSSKHIFPDTRQQEIGVPSTPLLIAWLSVPFPAD
jgi:hypothetical protein